MTEIRPSVLFVCVHNAGRSQMAAGYLTALAAGRVDVFSAGSQPADQVNQAAVTAMAEVGVNISGEIPQPWADEIVRAAEDASRDVVDRRPEDTATPVAYPFSEDDERQIEESLRGLGYLE